MNAIRQTQLLNKRELENATPPSASWHADYRDTAYIYIGGLHPDLTEGDVVTIFSQFGNPTHLNLIRDKETGKSKGFGFLKYEDQRSCDLAVDNFTGADVLGRLLRVDHTRYKKKDDEDEDTHRIDRWEQEVEADAEINGNGKRKSVESSDESGEVRHPKKKRRHILKEERELEEMLAITRDGEEEDPMREYLIREKREEVKRAREREGERERQSRHKHRHRRIEDEDETQEERRHKHRHRQERSDRHETHDDRRAKSSRDDRDNDYERRRRRHEDRGAHTDRDRHHGSHRHDSRERKSSRDRRSRREDD